MIHRGTTTEADCKRIADVLWCCFSMGYAEATLGAATALGVLAKKAADDAAMRAVRQGHAEGH